MELVPEEMKENDFQEYQEWRCWNTHLLKRMSKESGRPIIVPMTLYKKNMKKSWLVIWDEQALTFVIFVSGRERRNFTKIIEKKWWNFLNGEK